MAPFDKEGKVLVDEVQEKAEPVKEPEVVRSDNEAQRQFEKHRRAEELKAEQLRQYQEYARRVAQEGCCTMGRGSLIIEDHRPVPTPQNRF